MLDFEGVLCLQFFFKFMSLVLVVIFFFLNIIIANLAAETKTLKNVSTLYLLPEFMLFSTIV